MGNGYQKRDFEIIDYDLYNLEGFHRPFRGPSISNFEIGNYITCVGAAQTFGCYADEPFPYLIQQKIGMPVLNFGVAGAGPSFFLRRRSFIKKINEGKLAIIQVMSGRSESNSLFMSNGGEMLTRISDNKQLGAGPAYNELIKNNSKDFIKNIIEETRENWVQNNILLLKQITVPKILFWFSVREPKYQEKFRSSMELFGYFPQLVNDSMLVRLISYADCYVEAVSSEGLPQKLKSRFTGEEVSITKRSDLGGEKKYANDYYPSPEMHKLAADKLIPYCKSLFGKGAFR